MSATVSAAPEPYEPRPDPSSDLSLRSVTPVTVSVTDITVVVNGATSRSPALSSILRKRRSKDGHDDGQKTILDTISLDLPSGTLTAIIGGSGSGKTTL
jgi:ABC-type glutathione transport system ATPase component